MFETFLHMKMQQFVALPVVEHAALVIKSLLVNSECFKHDLLV